MRWKGTFIIPFGFSTEDFDRIVTEHAEEIAIKTNASSITLNGEMIWPR